MQSGYLAERKQLESLYKRRRLDVVYSQQPIQPLKGYYQPSEQINLVFQNSKHMIDLSKVKLYFRPMIKYDLSNLGLASQFLTMGITPINAESMLCLQSITFNGNQICANPQTSLLRTRNIWQTYYNNMMVDKEKNALHGKYGPAGYTVGSDTGSVNTGFVQNSITTPYGSGAIAAVSGVNPALAGGEVASRFDQLIYPRAIMSKLCAYNNESNFGTQLGATITSNAYYSQLGSVNADMLLTSAITTNTGSLNTAVFPLLPLCVTPSVAIYKCQQERFQNMRMRFLSSVTTPYIYPTIVSATGVYPQYSSLSTGPGTTGANTTWAADQNLSGAPEQLQMKMEYGITVQDQSAGSSNRALGTIYSSTTSTTIPAEQFTQLEVSLGQLSCELDQIGTICMDSTQVVVQLQLNLPQNCLSAYLQPSWFNNGTTQGAFNNPSNASIQAFLNGCWLGQKATYLLADVCARIEYQTYPDESYAIVRELLRQPKAYQSVRQQIDVISVADGFFTQRLSIGSSSIINAIVMFIVPSNNNKVTNSIAAGATGRPQDTVVNYDGCQPPFDLRGTYIDSYYIPMSSVYAEVDSRRYESLDIPLSNPSFNTYLKTQQGVTTALGKFLDVSLQEYTRNRFMYVIPVNPYNDREMMIHDQQVVITVNFDTSQRVASSALWNETTQSTANQFSLLSFAICAQSVVDCSYIKV